jgi:hypothetical protein
MERQSFGRRSAGAGVAPTAALPHVSDACLTALADTQWQQTPETAAELIKERHA